MSVGPSRRASKVLGHVYNLTYRPYSFDWEGDGNAQGDPVPATEVPVGKAPITEPVKSTKPASKPVAKPVGTITTPYVLDH